MILIVSGKKFLVLELDAQKFLIMDLTDQNQIEVIVRWLKPNLPFFLKKRKKISDKKGLSDDIFAGTHPWQLWFTSLPRSFTRSL